MLRALWEDRTRGRRRPLAPLNLPSALPAPIVQARVGRDKIAARRDCIAGGTTTLPYRRGRPEPSFPATRRSARRRRHLRGAAWLGRRRADSAGRRRGWSGLWVRAGARRKVLSAVKVSGSHRNSGKERTRCIRWVNTSGIMPARASPGPDRNDSLNQPPIIRRRSRSVRSSAASRSAAVPRSSCSR